MGEMVVASQKEEGESITFIVTDASSACDGGHKRHVVHVTTNHTVDDLVKAIADQLSFESNSFSLKINEQDVVEEGDPERTKRLCEFGYSGKPRVVLGDKDGNAPVRVAGPAQAPASIEMSPWPSSGTPVSSVSSYPSYSYGASARSGKSSSGYVGLSNQGATCYLNSLLQTLYMTPEFRNAMYKWEFTGSPAEAEHSIPYQLQRLFLLLQTGDHYAIETKSLTKSFGWDSGEAFQQHDIQELLRVLFDALEAEFKGTPLDNIINQLYQGEMKDYVHCKNCHNESARVDTFLDVQLVIRPFGSTVVHKSVDECFASYLEPELLEGDNKYFCEKCEDKQDALKGLGFTRFPPLLTLQLKRFEFDFETMRRIKLNDRVEFPTGVLDMGKFIAGQGEVARKVSSKRREMGAPSPTKAAAKTSTVPDEMLLNDEEKESDNMEVDDKPQGASADQNQYELFSVMIHSGGALGGHYYAYIKNLDEGTWYNFNDSTVSAIDVADIEKAFGGANNSGLSYSYGSSANAYMLLYRRVDANKESFCSEDELPGHVREMLECEREAERKKREEEELAKKMINLTVYCYHPGEMDVRYPDEKAMRINHECTLAEATQRAYSLFEIEKRGVPLGRTRLRNYTIDIPGRTHTGKEDQTLQQLHFMNHSLLLLEVLEDGEHFKDYDPDNMMLRTVALKPDGMLDTPKRIWIDRTATLLDLKRKLATQFGVVAETLRVVKDTPSYRLDAPPTLLRDDSASLRFGCSIQEGDKVYFDALAAVKAPVGDSPNEWSDMQDNDDTPMTPADECAEEDFSQSTLAKAIDRARHTIIVNWSLASEVKNGSSDAEEPAHTIHVDQRITLQEFKELVAPEVGLDESNFRVYRHTQSVTRTEIHRSAHSLQGNGIVNKSWVVFEEGAALKPGEYQMDIHHFNPMVASKAKLLFTLNVHEDALVCDVKERVSKQLLAHDINIPVHRMRVREMMYNGSPGNVFFGNTTWREAQNPLYNGKDIAIQSLDQEEPKKSKDDIVIFIQRWLPSQYALGTRYEEVFAAGTTLDAMRNHLAESLMIEPSNLGIAKVHGVFQDMRALEVANMHFDVEKDTSYEPATGVSIHQSSLKGNLLSEGPYYLSDGSFIIVKDDSEAEKVLTPEEKAALQKESQQKRGGVTYGGVQRKERALKIKSKATLSIDHKSTDTKDAAA